MELAKDLIRTTVRAFYDTKHVLVVDALMIHSALPNDDLAKLLGMMPKDLRKLCGKLREDRLVTAKSRPETRDGLARPINREYYYIDFHATIDAIKYRVFQLHKIIAERYRPASEKKDYHCPRCKAEWAELEVLDHTDPVTYEFLCNRCDAPLERDDTAATNSIGHEKQSKLNFQLKKIMDALPKIDAQDIPQNDFDHAIAHALPIPVAGEIDPSKIYRPVMNAKTMAVSGDAPKSTAETAIEIDFSSASKDASRAAEEALKKKALAEANALPDWYIESTVKKGELTALGLKESERRAQEANTNGPEPAAPANGVTVNGEGVDDKADVDVSALELQAYYEQMQREQAKAEELSASEAEDDEDEDDFDEDDVFEDVGINGDGDSAPTSKVETPSSTASGLPPSALKRPREHDAENGESKRVKFEPGLDGTEENGSEKRNGTIKTEADDEDDDEDEFEDV